MILRTFLKISRIALQLVILRTFLEIFQIALHPVILRTFLKIIQIATQLVILRTFLYPSRKSPKRREITLDTPCSAMVTPYSTSANSMVAF